ncbi:MAG: C1 family peptidase [Bacteroidota bacterium]
MNKKTALILLSCLIGSSTYSQDDKRDKGQYMEYENEFYEEILKSFEEDASKKEPGKIFKMDQEGLVVPKSVDEFTRFWCNDPVSQGRTGMCWCYATISFYEAEIYRLTKQQIKLSEIYIAYWEYIEKAREYVITRGKSHFAQGSETNAVPRMMKKYGIVPLESYSGLKSGQKYPDHSKMFDEMKHFLETTKRDNAWNEEEVLTTIRSILDYYIGEPPKSATVNGKTMTPLEYLKNVAKINPDDYVDFMSLMEAPYYTKAEWDVPDNWWNCDDYNNVPLDEFMNAVKKAIKDGYSIAIGGDVSESGYNALNDVAMIPTYDIPSEYIDENARQLRFTNSSTTDDHAIHLIGYKEMGDDLWYLIKDSGSGSRNGKNPGYYFYHEDYVKLKMMTFTIHKDAVKELLKKVK